MQNLNKADRFLHIYSIIYFIYIYIYIYALFLSKQIFVKHFVLLFTVLCVVIQFMKITNKMQLCRIIYCSLTALHVSGDIFAHHQEHLNCMYSFWYYSHVSLTADIEDEYIFILDISRQRHTCVIPEAVHTV